MSNQGAFYMNEYDELKQFETKEEMNELVKAVRYHFAAELNKTAVTVLDYIAQYAVTVLGVAKLKVQRIADAIGKSVRTVGYATARLYDLGILNKVETLRPKSGGNGANVYVINANAIDCKADCRPNCRPQIAGGEVGETPTESKDELAKSENETLYSFKTLSQTPLKDLKDFEKNNNTNLVKDIELEDEPLFADTNKFLRIAYAGLSSLEGNEITKRLVLAFKKSGMSQTTEWTLQEYSNLHEDFARELADRVRICVRKDRDGKVNDSMYGYIYATAKKFFENHIAVLNGATANDSEELDLFNTPLFERVVNAKTARFNASIISSYNPYSSSEDFDNEDLPY